MHFKRLFRGVMLSMAFATLMFVPAHSWAQKGSKPSGGGGGSGPSYKIFELDSVVDGANLTLAAGAECINNTGLIVGGASDPVSGTSFAACWRLDSSHGTVTSILQLLQGGTAAFGVNDVGEIVGERNGTAVYWRNADDVSPIFLPALSVGSPCRAVGINRHGVICGWSRGSDGIQYAVVWRVRISPTDGTGVWGPLVLPSFQGNTGAQYAAAVDHNDSAGLAQVVGGSQGAIPLALTWTIESVSDGTLRVVSGPVDLDIGSAQGVNSIGLICGASQSNAVIWDATSGASRFLDRSGSMTISGVRRSFDSAQANAINSMNTTVGYASAGLHPAAVAWATPTSPMTVLDKFLKNSTISELNFATGLNAAGDIVGSGWNNNRGISVGYVAIPQ